MERFLVAMGYVALAILDFERHRLAGIVTWHMGRLPDVPRAWVEQPMVA